MNHVHVVSSVCRSPDEPHRIVRKSEEALTSPASISSFPDRRKGGIISPDTAALEATEPYPRKYDKEGQDCVGSKNDQEVDLASCTIVTTSIQIESNGIDGGFTTEGQVNRSVQMSNEDKGSLEEGGIAVSKIAVRARTTVSGEKPANIILFSPLNAYILNTSR